MSNRLDLFSVLVKRTQSINTYIKDDLDKAKVKALEHTHTHIVSIVIYRERYNKITEDYKKIVQYNYNFESKEFVVIHLTSNKE